MLRPKDDSCNDLSSKMYALCLYNHIIGASVFQVVKKEYESNRGVTPLHFACINPNPAYLEKLLTITPDINFMDKR